MFINNEIESLKFIPYNHMINEYLTWFKPDPGMVHKFINSWLFTLDHTESRAQKWSKHEPGIVRKIYTTWTCT